MIFSLYGRTRVQYGFFILRTLGITEKEISWKCPHIGLQESLGMSDAKNNWYRQISFVLYIWLYRTKFLLKSQVVLFSWRGCERSCLGKLGKAMGQHQLAPAKGQWLFCSWRQVAHKEYGGKHQLHIYQNLNYQSWAESGICSLKQVKTCPPLSLGDGRSGATLNLLLILLLRLC